MISSVVSRRKEKAVVSTVYTLFRIDVFLVPVSIILPCALGLPGLWLFILICFKWFISNHLCLPIFFYYVKKFESKIHRCNVLLLIQVISVMADTVAHSLYLMTLYG